MPDGMTPKRVSRLKAVAPKAAEPSKPKMLLFGKPGIGKTWFSLDFPACYYIDTEVGKEDIMNTKQSVMNFPNIEQTVRNMCNLICRNPQKTITKETRFYDEVAGRGRTEKTESPLDAPENGDDLEELPQ